MRKILGVLLIMVAASTSAADALLDQEFRRLASDEVVNIGDEYGGNVLLIVNTASKCGNTPQYDGLEKLFQKYGERGLVVLGFPSNDFLGQEPGTEDEIEEFCRLTYKVDFPMFEKQRSAPETSRITRCRKDRKSGSRPIGSQESSSVVRSSTQRSNCRRCGSSKRD
jgi:glutathione peroxidase